MQNLDFLRHNNHKPYLFNTVLWSCSFTALLFAFSKGNNPSKIDFIYTGSFIITIMLPVIINLYLLMPIYLKKGKYLVYTLLFILNLYIFTKLNIWFFEFFIDFVFPDYFFISYHSNTKLITIFSVFLIGTTLIKLSEDWFYYNNIENKKLKANNQHIQNQLTTLRSQINPHFLFNSLNVIYALALEKKEETTNAIVQLSDILRYVIYDSNIERVKLKDEIDLLKNYIEFQKLRDNTSKKIEFIYECSDDNYQIYPMLLLPLVENAFKYGINKSTEDSYIKINIGLINNEFNFYVENNYNVDNSNSNNESSGLGLDNIKKNLNIVYPQKHLFNIENIDNRFCVTLKIFANEN